MEKLSLVSKNVSLLIQARLIDLRPPKNLRGNDPEYKIAPLRRILPIGIPEISGWLFHSLNDLQHNI